MSIFWLQQTMADVPTDNSWLSANEVLRLSGMKFPKRRSDWRLGRWTAKRAIAAYLGWRAESGSLNDIEIRAAASGAPEAFIAEQQTSLGLSLSHSAGRAIAALVPSGMPVGCDLEKIELRISAFVSDYFTPEEQSLVQETAAPYRPAFVTLLWSAKESALKALGQGLRLDIRSLSVDVSNGQETSGQLAAGFRRATGQAIQQPACELEQAGWRALQVFCDNSGPKFYGWWQVTDDFVWTVVAAAPLLPPIQLNPRLQVRE